MNREQRRRAAKAEKRNGNSKKNYVYGGIKEIPVSQLVHDDNLKECDSEVTELISKRFEWAERNMVKNDMSKVIIVGGCNYLDSLCSLRFDITPNDDKILVRNAMYYIGNFANMFIAMMAPATDEFEPYKKDMTIAEVIENKAGDIPVVYDTYPFELLPNNDAVDDMYAEFVVKHANELAPLFLHIRRSQIAGDEEYICEVLDMIIRKTNELLPEAQVQSSKFMVNMRENSHEYENRDF